MGTISSRQCQSQDRPEGIMQKILGNEGLWHIVTNISSYLDLRDLANCQLTCQSWRKILENDRRWLIFKLEHIQRSKKTFLNFCERKMQGDYIPKKQSIQERFQLISPQKKQLVLKTTHPQVLEKIQKKASLNRFLK